MPLVTKIKPLKNKKRVNIYVNGEYGFGLDLTTYVKSKIVVGKEYDQNYLNTLVSESDFATTLEKLYNYAMLRPRSEKEINDWFYRKKVDKSMQPDLIEKLVKQGLYGDERFAKWWVEQRLQFKNKSMRELQNELQSKGVNRSVITDILSSSEYDESASIKKLLNKNSYKWSKLDKKMAKKKQIDFLLRKGFAWDAVRRAIDDLEQKV